MYRERTINRNFICYSSLKVTFSSLSLLLFWKNIKDKLYLESYQQSFSCLIHHLQHHICVKQDFPQLLKSKCWKRNATEFWDIVTLLHYIFFKINKNIMMKKYNFYLFVGGTIKMYYFQGCVIQQSFETTELHGTHII